MSFRVTVTTASEDVQVPQFRPNHQTKKRSRRDQRRLHPWVEELPSTNYHQDHGPSHSNPLAKQIESTQRQLVSIPAIVTIPTIRVQSVGPAHLNIYRGALPVNLRCGDVFSRLIDTCEQHVTDWQTNLFSLTKQDLALYDVPGAISLVREIHDFVENAVRQVFYVKRILMDRNQPHVLKYGPHHTWVPLHYDTSDVTMNMMMSESTDFTGGGTYFVDLNGAVYLQQGEFLLHPGNAVHGGLPITSGTRYLLVSFLRFPRESENQS